VINRKLVKRGNVRVM